MSWFCCGCLLTAVSPLHAFSMGICSISSSCPTPSEISAANSDQSSSNPCLLLVQCSVPSKYLTPKRIKYVLTCPTFILQEASGVSASSLRLPLVSPFVWALPREPFPLAPGAGPRQRDDQWRPPAREGGASRCAHLRSIQPMSCD